MIGGDSRLFDICLWISIRAVDWIGKLSGAIQLSR